MSELSMQQKRADMEACAPWIREALKSTNQRAKELQEKLDQLSQASLALKGKLEEKQAEVNEWKEKCERLQAGADRQRLLSSGTEVNSSPISSPAVVATGAGSAANSLKPLHDSLGSLFDNLPGAGALTSERPAAAAAAAAETDKVPPGAVGFTDLGPRAIARADALLATINPAICGAIAAAQKNNELDDVALHMYTVMDSLGKGLELIRYAIDQEVEQQKEIQTLFRSNNLASKLLKHFTARVGQAFVTAALGRGIARVQAMEVLEIDPAKVPSDVAERNVAKLGAECEAFLTDIIAALPTVPAPMREVCNHIAKRVGAKFREEKARVLGVGAYVILRVLGPPLLLGDSRTLILVSKVVQNLANQVLFGKKEVFMTPLNAVVKSNQERVNAFLLEMAQLDEHAPEDRSAPHEASAVQAAAELLCAPAVAAIASPALTEVHTVAVPVTRAQMATALIKQGVAPNKGGLSEELFVRADCVLGVVALATDDTVALANLFDIYRTPELVERFVKSTLTDVGPDMCCKAVAAVFSTYGRDQVKAMLAQAIASAVQGNLRLEVESSQLKSVDSVEENAASLIAMCQKAVEATLSTMMTLPRALWNVLSAGPVDLLLVEGVLVPALRDPVSFSVAPRAVKPECERTLSLLAALIRLLIMGGPSKIEFPASVRTFVDSNQKAVQGFLRDWIALKPAGTTAALPVSNRKADFVALRAVLSRSGGAATALKGVQPGVLVSLSFRDVLSLGK